MCSDFADAQLFKCKFSSSALKTIVIVGLINLIIEDIPQFIIQILYKANTTGFSVIPFISLVLSSLVLLSTIISRLYDILIQFTHDEINDNKHPGNALQSIPDSVQTVNIQNIFYDKPPNPSSIQNPN
ncbi:636_t:CDS:2, partial [Scutellospora calospora]